MGKKFIIIACITLFSISDLFYTQEYLPFSVFSESDFLLIHFSPDNKTTGILNENGELSFRETKTGQILGLFCFGRDSVNDYCILNNTTAFVIFFEPDNYKPVIKKINFKTGATELYPTSIQEPVALQIIQDDLVVWGNQNLEHNSKTMVIPGAEIHKLSYSGSTMLYPDTQMLKLLIDNNDPVLDPTEVYFSLVNLMLRSYYLLDIPNFYQNKILSASESAVRKKMFPVYYDFPEQNITITKSASEIKAYTKTALPYYNLDIPVWTVSKQNNWMTDIHVDEKEKKLFIESENKKVQVYQKGHINTLAETTRYTQNPFWINDSQANGFYQQDNDLIYQENDSIQKFGSVFTGTQKLLSAAFERDKVLILIKDADPDFYLAEYNPATLKKTGVFLDPVKPIFISTTGFIVHEDKIFVYVSGTDEAGTGKSLVWSVDKNLQNIKLTYDSPKSIQNIAYDHKNKRLMFKTLDFGNGNFALEAVSTTSTEKPWEYLLSSSSSAEKIYKSDKQKLIVFEDQNGEFLVFNSENLTLKKILRHPLGFKTYKLLMLDSGIIAFLSDSNSLLFYDMNQEKKLLLFFMSDPEHFALYNFQTKLFMRYHIKEQINYPQNYLDPNLAYLDSLLTMP